MRSCCLLILMLSLTQWAWAHRVNIFAYLEGSDVLVECGFSRSNPVCHGQIEVYDQNNNLLLQGQTDALGHFRFPIPQEVLGSGSGLTIKILAGEGHQNEWTIDNSELAGISAPEPSAALAHGQQSESEKPQRIDNQPETSSLSRQELEEIINIALDAKLAPIKRAVLEKQGPGLTEIIGGIGWILGLAGVVAYFKGRPRV